VRTRLVNNRIDEQRAVVENNNNNAVDSPRYGSRSDVFSRRRQATDVHTTHVEGKPFNITRKTLKLIFK